MLKVRQFAFNPFGENTYVVYDADTRDAIVVDPGMTSAREHAHFDDFVAREHLKINQIVNTHLHLDHCFGNNYVRDKYGVKTAAHIGDAQLGQMLGSQMQAFGVGADDQRSVDIDVPLHQGDTIAVGNSTLEVLEVPGHSQGSIVLYSREGNFAIVGDVLFRGSIGRTDLPGGDHATLIRGIKEKLLTLPDSTLILPGHDASTTIANERHHNPYLQ